MKTYRQFSESASEDQIRKQNPNASPEMVRRAAERSKRSESQRDANEAMRKATPGGSIVKRTSSAMTTPKEKSSALAKNKPSKGGALTTTNAAQKSNSGPADNKKQYKHKVEDEKQDLGKYGAHKKEPNNATTRERSVETKQRRFDVTRQPTSMSSARRMKTANDIRAARRKSQGKSPEERKKAVFDARAKSGRKGVNAIDLGKAKIDREKRKFRQAPLDYTKNAVGKPVAGVAKSVLRTAKSTSGSVGTSGSGDLQSGKGTKLDRG